MSNKELKKGLDLIIEGLSTISKSLGGEEKPTKKTESKVDDVMNIPVEVEESSSDMPDLDKMKYTDLKKYAAEIGVDAAGTRDQLVDRITAHFNGGIDEEEPEEVEAEVEEAKEEDEYLAKANEALEDNDVEDVIEMLADCGIKANKKNVAQKLADAFKQGLIDASDDDDEDAEESGEAEEVEDDNEGISLGDYVEEFDPEGFNDPEGDYMTDDRQAACDELVSDILTKIEKGKLKHDTMVSFLENNLTEDEGELIDDADDEAQVTAMYLELQKRFIDGEGEQHEPSDPYYIKEEAFCCGHKLKYDRKGKKYVCEVCGEEYEDEDE